MNTQPKTTAIHLIGPRSSGKTTYLGTLAYFPHKKILQSQYTGLSVSYDRETDVERLARMVEDILKRGQKLAGTRRQEVEDIPYYYYRIKIPAIKKLAATQLEVTFRDIAGEIFEEIPLEAKWNEVQPYLEDLFTVPSWMIMLTAWEPGQDTRLYKPAFERLCQEILERQETNPAIQGLRIAVVMSKCERGEIWSGRLEPDEDLFRVRLPETYQLLTETFSQRSNRLKFFACSSFGVLSMRREDFDPRPNRYIPDDGSPADYTAFLRDTSRWQPFGLISPIYWLSTGNMFHDPSL